MVGREQMVGKPNVERRPQKSFAALSRDSGQKRALAMKLVEDYAVASTWGIIVLPRNSYY